MSLSLRLRVRVTALARPRLRLRYLLASASVALRLTAASRCLASRRPSLCFARSTSSVQVVLLPYLQHQQLSHMSTSLRTLQRQVARYCLAQLHSLRPTWQLLSPCPVRNLLWSAPYRLTTSSCARTSPGRLVLWSHQTLPTPHCFINSRASCTATHSQLPKSARLPST